MPQWIIDLLKNALSNPLLRKMVLETLRTALNKFIDELEADPAKLEAFVNALIPPKS